MIELEPNYEKLRKILSPIFGARLPRNELTDTLLHAIYSEEEARILAKGIKRGIWPTTVRRIRKRAGISKKEAKEIIKDMEYKGKIIKYAFLEMNKPIFHNTISDLSLKLDSKKRSKFKKNKLYRNH